MLELLRSDLTRRAPQGGGGFNRFAHSAGPGWRAVCLGVEGLFASGSGGAGVLEMCQKWLPGAWFRKKFGRAPSWTFSGSGWGPDWTPNRTKTSKLGPEMVSDGSQEGAKTLRKKGPPNSGPLFQPKKLYSHRGYSHIGQKRCLFTRDVG